MSFSIYYPVHFNQSSPICGLALQTKKLYILLGNYENLVNCINVYAHYITPGRLSASKLHPQFTLGRWKRRFWEDIWPHRPSFAVVLCGEGGVGFALSRSKNAQVHLWLRIQVSIMLKSSICSHWQAMRGLGLYTGSTVRGLGLYTGSAVRCLGLYTGSAMRGLGLYTGSAVRGLRLYTGSTIRGLGLYTGSTVRGLGLYTGSTVSGLGLYTCSVQRGLGLCTCSAVSGLGLYTGSAVRWHFSAVIGEVLSTQWQHSR